MKSTDLLSFNLGDVIRVDDKLLNTLDAMEEVPTFYIRRKEDISMTDGTIQGCFVYILPNFKSELLDCDMLQSYSASDPSIKPFVARYINYKTKLVINDPFGQRTVPAGSDLRLILKSWDGRTDNSVKIVITTVLGRVDQFYSLYRYNNITEYEYVINFIFSYIGTRE